MPGIQSRSGALFEWKSTDRRPSNNRMPCRLLGFDLERPHLTLDLVCTVSQSISVGDFDATVHKWYEMVHVRSDTPRDLFPPESDLPLLDVGQNEMLRAVIYETNVRSARECFTHLA